MSATEKRATVEIEARAYAPAGPYEPAWSVELRELRYFVAAAEELHFTRAAERMHIAQQALSAAIAQLELRLGAALFERTTRRVRLTAAGEALVPAAQDTLAAAERAVAAARDGARGVTGRLRVGVSRSAHCFGGPVLLSMRKHAPRVETEVRIDFTQPLLEGVVAGDLDAAFLYCPEHRSDLCYRRLSDQPAMVVVHPDHLLARSTTLQVGDLSEEILVLAGPGIGRGYNTAVLSLCRGDAVPQRTVEATGYLGPAGYAPHETIGITATVALDGLPIDFELVRIPLEGCTLPFDLVWHRQRDSALLDTLRSVATHVAGSSDWPLAVD
jgi:DNA-binding transcriptional LysR family regulator